MKKIGHDVAAKFARLSGREKIYVYAALLVISVYIVFALAVDPAQRRAGVLRKQIVDQKAQIENLRASGQPLPKALDPNPAQQAKNEDLQRSIEELDAK